MYQNNLKAGKSCQSMMIARKVQGNLLLYMAQMIQKREQQFMRNGNGA